MKSNPFDREIGDEIGDLDGFRSTLSQLELGELAELLARIRTVENSEPEHSVTDAPVLGLPAFDRRAYLD